MPHALYVCLQDDNKIAVFAIDSESGQLSPRAEVPVAGGPSVMGLSPDLQNVYVGTRTESAFLTYGIGSGHGPHSVQCNAAAARQPRPKCQPAVSVRCGNRASEPQFFVPC